MATSIDWYFDFVSPYSYFSLLRLNELPARICCKPVLLAGLLTHWGQKGPAEIPAKRRWTYRECAWKARELGIPFRFPGQHPFNPLPYLRLALAAGSTEPAIKRIFEVLWTGEDDALHERRFDALCIELGVDRAGVDESKDALRLATADAASRGVFGVPSFVVDGEVFWGSDSMNFLKAFLKDETVVRNDEMRRVDALPVGAARKP